MIIYSRELLGYAVALFGCYGVFVSVGLGRVGWCLVFLLVSVVAALAVMVREGTWGAGLASSVVVMLNCAFAFALGWGGYQVLLWAVRR